MSRVILPSVKIVVEILRGVDYDFPVSAALDNSYNPLPDRATQQTFITTFLKETEITKMEYYAAADKSPDPQFGAFRSEGWESTDRCNSAQKSQVTENKQKKGARLSLTTNDRKVYSSAVPKIKDKLTIPARVAFILTPTERQICQAAHEKHGIAKATDILRMALRRWAEAEGFKVAG